MKLNLFKTNLCILLTTQNIQNYSLTQADLGLDILEKPRVDCIFLNLILVCTT